MGKTKEVYAQLAKDVPLEAGMKPLVLVLLAKFSNAIRYGSTSSDNPFTLTYRDMVQFMRNVQEAYTSVAGAVDLQGRIDLGRFTGRINTITNSNPTSSIMAIRYPDTMTPVTSQNIPARSCSLDLTRGDPKLIPLAIAANSKACTDADYLMSYRHDPASQYSFYFNPITANPLHCLFTHPLQLPAEEYKAAPDGYREQLRTEFVEPYWTREIRLSPKIANYRIEV
jgi:hypothetical protein